VSHILIKKPFPSRGTVNDRKTAGCKSASWSIMP
jgi:hypothetical protein